MPIKRIAVRKVAGYAAIFASAVALLGSAGFSYAQDEPDPRPTVPSVTEHPNADDGEVVARKLCSSCHLMGDPPEGPINADIPSFKHIANRPQQTEDKLIGWLSAPHAPMPDPHLTRQEIMDLAAYINGRVRARTLGAQPVGNEVTGNIYQNPELLNEETK